MGQDRCLRFTGGAAGKHEQGFIAAQASCLRQQSVLIQVAPGFTVPDGGNVNRQIAITECENTMGCADAVS